jgi:hypothetical protein
LSSSNLNWVYQGISRTSWFLVTLIFFFNPSCERIGPSVFGELGFFNSSHSTRR